MDRFYKIYSGLIDHGCEDRHIGILVFRLSDLELHLLEFRSVKIDADLEHQRRLDDRDMVLEGHVKVLETAHCKGVSVEIHYKREHFQSIVLDHSFDGHPVDLSLLAVPELKFLCETAEDLVVAHGEVLAVYPDDSVYGRSKYVHACVKACCSSDLAVYKALERVQQRHNRVYRRHHRYDFFSSHVAEVEVEACAYVLLGPCRVESLEFGRSHVCYGLGPYYLHASFLHDHVRVEFADEQVGEPDVAGIDLQVSFQV